MHYKLIVLDIDGTTRNSKHLLTERTRETVLRLQQNGQRIAIASGRAFSGTKETADVFRLGDHNGYILSFNGGMVTECASGRRLVEELLPTGIICKIWEFAAAHGLDLYTYTEDLLPASSARNPMIILEAQLNSVTLHPVSNFDGYRAAPLYKCALCSDPAHLRSIYASFVEAFGASIDCTFSEPYLIDIMPKGISKGGALQKLAQKLSIDRSEIIAFGDGYNDIGMLRFAGRGVAMGNASQEVKIAADDICLSNDEDGVAAYLEGMGSIGYCCE